MSDKDLIEKKKRSLTAQKGQVTKALQRLEDTLSQPEADNDVIQELLENLNKRYEKVEGIYDTLSELIESGEQIEQMAVEIESCLAKVQDTRIKAKKKMSKKPPLTSSVGANTSQAHVNLPELHLPKFKGDILEFPRFWDLFSNTVDKDPKLSPVHKFTYLTGYLEDEAADVVKELRVTEENYQEAKELLKERYHRPDALIFRHIHCLLHLETDKSKNKDNLSKLRSVMDQVNIHVRSLDTLGIKGADYGVILVPLILSRLPHEIVCEWSRKSKNKERDLQYLLDLCNEEIHIKERTQSVRITSLEKPADKTTANLDRERRRPKPNLSRATAAALTTVENRCIFCNRNGHDASVCRTVRSFTWDQIKEAIQKAGVCYKCLNSGHIAKTCKVTCSSCGRGHHSNICRPRQETESPGQSNSYQSRQPITQKSLSQDKETKTQPQQDDTSASLNVSCTAHASKETIMQMTRVEASGLKAHSSVNILFDSGSNCTYIKKELADKLGCKKVRSVQHQVSMFGGHKTKSTLKMVREVQLTDQCGNLHKIEAIETTEVCAPLVQPKINTDNLPQELKLATIPFGMVKIEILIGLDNYYKFLGDQVIRLNENLVAHKTPFGHIVSGVVGTSSDKAVLSHQLFVRSSSEQCNNYWENDFNLHCQSTQVQKDNDCSAQEDIACLWNLEWLGVDENVVEEDSIFTKFKRQLRFDEDERRYAVKLPWKPLSSQLQSNEETAKKRCIKQITKLSPEQHSLYMNVFKEWEDNKIIEDVPVEEMNLPKERKVFYLPHRPVIREESITTKIRPVFDGSATDQNGLSINDALYTGPKLQNDIVDILIRFRTHQVALTADISKAFLQIQLSEEDKDSCRFFLPTENGSLRVMRFRRLPFGLNSSPFILNGTLKVHLSKYNSKTAEELKRNLYVDDLLTGEDNATAANLLYREANQIMQDASMPLAKWRSNVKEFKDSNIPETKVLGLFWDSETDEFHYGGIKIPVEVVVTKRLILSCIARVFDPLGYISPYIIKAKILFQEAWFQGLEWDQEVTPQINEEFKKWIEGLQEIKDHFKVKRQYIQNRYTDEDKSLTVFCDASEKAYGAAIYLKSSQGFSLIIAKAKVAPIKKVSLPRLELIACVMGSLLLKKVKTALSLEKTNYQCYTDSEIALQYIKQSPDKWKPFIANRVMAIQETTDPSLWRHIPGEKNPADALTRGVPATKFIRCVNAYVSPAMDLLPHQNPDSSDINSAPNSPSWPVSYYAHQEDIKSDDRDDSRTLIENRFTKPFISCERWSKFTKAMRVMAFVLRFIANCRSKAKKMVGHISPTELAMSKETLIRCTQKAYFQDEIKLLQKGSSIPKGSKLYPLTPFLDNTGIMRIKGRLENSDLSYESVHPVILPGCWLARLVVRDYHKSMHHAGISTLLNAIRQKYWIIGLRRMAKSEVKLCFQCQRIQATACNQQSPNLPKERVTKQHPFAVTGVDFAGPLYVTDTDEKHYICLYTCMTIRAVHLELTSSLKHEDFLKSFRRFSARRGIPQTMYSDNASTFVKARDKINIMYGDQAPQWKFITPRSPWKGGCWERMVRTVKSHLKKVLGNQTITKDELETVLPEIEYVVNTRPLTTVTDAPTDIRPLTPADFVLNRENLDFSTPKSIQKSLVTGTQQLHKFWKLWSNSYLKGLPRMVPTFKEKGNLLLGSVVLIKEDNLPRLQWPLARIIDLMPSDDGRIRTVRLKTAKGSCVRPVQKLHLLESAKDEALPSDDCQMSPVITKHRKSKTAHLVKPSVRSSVKPVKEIHVTTRTGRVVRKPHTYGSQ